MNTERMGQIFATTENAETTEILKNFLGVLRERLTQQRQCLKGTVCSVVKLFSGFTPLFTLEYEGGTTQPLTLSID